MKRISLLLFLGASLVSLSFGQVTSQDSSARADTSASLVGADTTQKVLAPGDSLSGIAGDSLAINKSNILREQSAVVDTIAVPKESLQQDTTAKKSTSPGLSSLPSTAVTMDPNGYRDARWGMTLKEVHDYLLEHDNIDEYAILDLSNGFEYTGSLAGVKCKIAYQFDNDRLFIVRLTPQVKATTKFDYLDSFEDYASTLEAKYGKPSRSGFHKNDESYLNTIETIQLGFAKKYALWEFERSYVVLVLMGQKGRLELHLTYLSRTIFDEMRNRIESLKLEDF